MIFLNHKKHFGIILGAMVCLAGICILVSQRMLRQNAIPPGLTNSALASSRSNLITSPAPILPPTNAAVASVRQEKQIPKSLEEEEDRKAHMAMKKWLLEKNQPIEFHARVLNQDNRPVAGVRLELELSRIDVEKVIAEFPHMRVGSELKHERVVLQSDETGWFRLSNRMGTLLSVEKFSCDGYEWKHDGYIFFDYEGEDPFADFKVATKGYVFWLWKKGPTEKLIPINFKATLAKDHLQAWFKLFPIKGVEISEADADFAIVKTFLHPTDPNRQYDRRITIVGLKGLEIVETLDPYPYAAPEAGYVSELYYDVLPSQGYGPHGHWDWKKNFYLKARGGRIYGALTINFDSNRMAFGLSGYLNANGSRILEPDPDKFITNRLEIQRIDEATRAN